MADVDAARQGPPTGSVPQVSKLPLSQTASQPDSRQPSPPMVLPVNMAPRLSSPRLAGPSLRSPRSPREKASPRPALTGVQEGNEDLATQGDEAAMQECEHRKEANRTARMHQEAHATLKHMFQQAHGDDNILRNFIAFVAKDRETWDAFWARFRPDGTMTWQEFEKYIWFDQMWGGETFEAFGLLEEKHCGYITKSRCLQLKRWWKTADDLRCGNIDTFKKRLKEHYGSLARAWRLAFDVESKGSCCFNHFCRVCSKVGMIVQVKSVWAQLTEGVCSRSVRLRDLDPEGDMVIQMFAMSLTLHGGTMFNGWRQIMVDIGGHLHRDAFIERCASWGIGFHVAKWLFRVLDCHNVKYLTEWDGMDLLKHYDVGPVCAEAGSAIFGQQLVGTGSPDKPFRVLQNRDDELKDQEPFELRVILSKEEHEMYTSALRSKMMMMGIDLAGEAKRSPGQRRMLPVTPHIHTKTGDLDSFGPRE